MSADDNLKTIQTIYEAFGRGDVGVILDAVDDDVDWGVESATMTGPWYGPRHGKDGVLAFFEQFAAAMEVQEFTPTAFGANETDVFTVVRCRATSRQTGRPMDMNLHHYFRFRDGKISYYRGTEDSAQLAAALA